MHCEHIERLLSKYLDQECSRQEMLTVETHLEACETCRKLLTSFQNNDQLAMAAMTSSFFGDDCLQKIMKDVRRATPAKVRLKYDLRWLAYAAALLLVAGSFAFGVWYAKPQAQETRWEFARKAWENTQTLLDRQIRVNADLEGMIRELEEKIRGSEGKALQREKVLLMEIEGRKAESQILLQKINDGDIRLFEAEAALAEYENSIVSLRERICDDDKHPPVIVEEGGIVINTALALDFGNSLEWNLKSLESDAVLGYDVFRSEGADHGDDWEKLNDQPFLVSRFVDGDVVPGHDYQYKVAAILSGDSRSISNSVDVTAKNKMRISFQAFQYSSQDAKNYAWVQVEIYEPGEGENTGLWFKHLFRCREGETVGSDVWVQKANRNYNFDTGFVIDRIELNQERSFKSVRNQLNFDEKSHSYKNQSFVRDCNETRHRLVCKDSQGKLHYLWEGFRTPEPAEK